MSSAGPSSSKNKRGPPQDSSPTPTPSQLFGASSAHSQDTAMPPAKKQKKNKDEAAENDSKKKTPKQYHLKKNALTDDEQHINTAFQTHIRLLAGLHDQTAIPRKPSEAVLAAFDERFTTTQDYRNATVPLCTRLITLRNELANTRSTISKRLGRIEEGAIEMIIATLAHYHFDMWCPNLSDNAYSAYNMVHRTIACETFRQAVVNHDYTFIAPINLQKAQDKKLLVQLYSSYVWSYFKTIYDKEQRNPGAHQERLQTNKVLSRRSDLATRRLRYVQGDGFPTAIRLLVKEPAAHSDDEDDGQIRVKTGHSAHVTRFIREIDTKRKAWAPFQASSGNRIKERNCVLPAIPIPSALPAPPTQVPINWFDPAHFNVLPAAFRARYMNHKRAVALPSNYELIFDPNSDWKGLEDDEFMEIYGNEVLKRYKLPTEQELKNLREAANEDDEDEDDDEEEDDDEDALLFAFLSGTRPISGAGKGKDKGKDKGKGKAKAGADQDVEMDGQ
ncbi:hypothetical protein K435DRAFT_805455 [Dendrothele bispora CBS 962.96]|uniref:Uncharacterized protein n=1 Tax=Dendrothele bispora (strain CBS 962.96) TaxID=1314807 RepID=A0A4S8LBM8_DENBC|nr:hypothetical protein K435DRAFT_805455 [Dendrothele bispora CBS 962.96]